MGGSAYHAQMPAVPLSIPPRQRNNGESDGTCVAASTAAHSYVPPASSFVFTNSSTSSSRVPVLPNTSAPHSGSRGNSDTARAPPLAGGKAPSACSIPGCLSSDGVPWTLQHPEVPTCAASFEAAAVYSGGASDSGGVCAPPSPGGHLCCLPDERTGTEPRYAKCTQETCWGRRSQHSSDGTSTRRGPRSVSRPVALETVQMETNTSGGCGSSCVVAERENGLNRLNSHARIKQTHRVWAEGQRSHARDLLVPCCPSRCGTDRMSSAAFVTAAGASTCCCSTATHARGSQLDFPPSLFPASSSRCPGTSPAGVGDTVAFALSRMPLPSLVSSSAAGRRSGAVPAEGGASYEPGSVRGSALVREAELYITRENRRAECTRDQVELQGAVRSSYSSRAKVADGLPAGVSGGLSPRTVSIERSSLDTTQPVSDRRVRGDHTACHRGCGQEFSGTRCWSASREHSKERSGVVSSRTDRSSGSVGEDARLLRGGLLNQAQSDQAAIHNLIQTSQNEALCEGALARGHASKPRRTSGGQDRPVCCHPCGDTEHASDRLMKPRQEAGMQGPSSEKPSANNTSLAAHVCTRKPCAVREREYCFSSGRQGDVCGHVHVGNPICRALQKNEEQPDLCETSQVHEFSPVGRTGRAMVSTIRQVDETSAHRCHLSHQNSTTGTSPAFIGLKSALIDSPPRSPSSREVAVSAGLPRRPGAPVFPPLVHVDELDWGCPGSPRAQAYNSGQQNVQAYAGRRRTREAECFSTHFQDIPAAGAIQGIDHPSRGVSALFDPDADVPSASQSVFSSASWSPRSCAPPRTSSERGSGCPGNAGPRSDAPQITPLREESSRELQSPNSGLGVTKRRVGPASCVSIPFVSSGSSSSRSNTSFNSSSVLCPDNSVKGVVQRHGSGCSGHCGNPAVSESVPAALNMSPRCVSAEKVGRTGGCAGSCSSRTSNSGNAAGVTVTSTTARKPASAAAEKYGVSPSVTSESRGTVPPATASTTAASPVDARGGGSSLPRAVQGAGSRGGPTGPALVRSGDRKNSTGISEQPHDGREKKPKEPSSANGLSSTPSSVSLGRSSSSSSFVGVSKRTVRMWSAAAVAASAPTGIGQASTGATPQVESHSRQPVRANSAVCKFSGSSGAEVTERGQLVNTVPAPATKRRGRLVAPTAAGSDGTPFSGGLKAPLKRHSEGKASNVPPSAAAQAAAAELQSRAAGKLPAGGGGLPAVVGTAAIFGSLFAARERRQAAHGETDSPSSGRSRKRGETGREALPGISQGKKVIGENQPTRGTRHTGDRTGLSRPRGAPCPGGLQASSPRRRPGALTGNAGRLNLLREELSSAVKRKSAETRGTRELALKSPMQASAISEERADGCTTHTSGVRVRDPTAQASHERCRTASMRAATLPTELGALPSSVENVFQERSACKSDFSFLKASDTGDVEAVPHKLLGNSEGEPHTEVAHRLNYRVAPANPHHSTDCHVDGFSAADQSLKRDFHPGRGLSDDVTNTHARPKRAQEQSGHRGVGPGCRRLQSMVSEQVNPPVDEQVTWEPGADNRRIETAGSKQATLLEPEAFLDRNAPHRAIVEVISTEDDNRVHLLSKSHRHSREHAADQTCGACSCRHCLPAPPERAQLARGEHYPGNQGAKRETSVRNEDRTAPASRPGPTASLLHAVHEDAATLGGSPSSFGVRRGQTADVSCARLKGEQHAQVNYDLTLCPSKSPHRRMCEQGSKLSTSAGQANGAQQQQSLKASGFSKPSAAARAITRSTQENSLCSLREEEEVVDQQELFRQRQEQQQLRLRLLMTRGPPCLSPFQSPRRVGSPADTPEPPGSAHRTQADSKAGESCPGRHSEGTPTSRQAAGESKVSGLGADKVLRPSEQEGTLRTQAGERVPYKQRKKEDSYDLRCESIAVAACCQRGEDGRRRRPGRLEDQNLGHCFEHVGTHLLGQDRISAQDRDSVVNVGSAASGGDVCCAAASESAGGPSLSILGHKSACYSDSWNGRCHPSHCSAGSVSKRPRDTWGPQEKWELPRGPWGPEVSCSGGDPPTVSRCPTCNPGCCATTLCGPSSKSVARRVASVCGRATDHAFAGSFDIAGGDPQANLWSGVDCGPTADGSTCFPSPHSDFAESKPRTVDPPRAPHCSGGRAPPVSSFYAVEPRRPLNRYSALRVDGRASEAKRQVKPRSPCRCCGRRRRSAGYETSCGTESVDSRHSSTSLKSSAADRANRKCLESECMQACAKPLVRRPPPLKLPPSDSVLADVAVIPTAGNLTGVGDLESEEVQQAFEVKERGPGEPCTSETGDAIHLDGVPCDRARTVSLSSSGAPPPSMLLSRRPPRLEEPRGPCGCGGICGRNDSNATFNKLGSRCSLKAENAGDLVRNSPSPAVEGNNSCYSSAGNASRATQHAADDASCLSGHQEKHGKVSDSNSFSLSSSPRAMLLGTLSPANHQEGAQLHKGPDIHGRCDPECTPSGPGCQLVHKTSSATTRNTGPEIISATPRGSEIEQAQSAGSRCGPRSATCNPPTLTDEVLRPVQSLVYSTARNKRSGPKCVPSRSASHHELSGLVNRSTTAHCTLSQTALAMARIAAVEKHFRNDYNPMIDEDAPHDRRPNTSCSLSGKQSWLVPAAEKERGALDDAAQDAQRPRSGEDCVRKDRLRELYKMRRRRVQLSRGGASSPLSSKSSSDESGAGENGSSEVEDTEGNTTCGTQFRGTERSARSASFPEAVSNPKQTSWSKGGKTQTHVEKVHQDSTEGHEVMRLMSVPSGVLHPTPAEAISRGIASNRQNLYSSSPALCGEERRLPRSERHVRTDAVALSADLRESNLHEETVAAVVRDSLVISSRRTEEMTSGEITSLREGTEKGDNRLPSEAVSAASAPFASTAKERDPAPAKLGGHLYSLSAGGVQKDQAPLREDHRLSVFAAESADGRPADAFEAGHVVKCGPEMESGTTGETDREGNRSRRATKKRSAVAIEKKRSSTSAGSCDGFDDAASTPLFCSLSSSSFSSSSAAGPVDPASSWSVFSPADSHPRAAGEGSSRHETCRIPEQLSSACAEARVKTEQMSTPSSTTLHQQV